MATPVGPVPRDQDDPDDPDLWDWDPQGWDESDEIEDWRRSRTKSRRRRAMFGALMLLTMLLFVLAAVL